MKSPDYNSYLSKFAFLRYGVPVERVPEVSRVFRESLTVLWRRFSASTIRSFLVLLWTALNSALMFGHAILLLNVTEQKNLLGLGFDWFQGRGAVVASILIGIWGLIALALVHYSSRSGAVVLLLYSAGGCLAYGGGLFLDMFSLSRNLRYPRGNLSLSIKLYMHGFLEQVDWTGYLIQLGITVAFLLTAFWCWKRAFPASTKAVT